MSLNIRRPGSPFRSALLISSAVAKMERSTFGSCFATCLSRRASNRGRASLRTKTDRAGERRRPEALVSPREGVRQGGRHGGEQLLQAGDGDQTSQDILVEGAGS